MLFGLSNALLCEDSDKLEKSAADESKDSGNNYEAILNCGVFVADFRRKSIADTLRNLDDAKENNAGTDSACYTRKGKDT